MHIYIIVYKIYSYRTLTLTLCLYMSVHAPLEIMICELAWQGHM